MSVTAIILARGGSKGIPNKNLIDFCGKPLISWTIEQIQSSSEINDVWVSSDSKDILDVAAKHNINLIKRPETISGDMATSESGWMHAIDYIESTENKKIDIVFAPQVTSPIRTSADIDNAIKLFIEKGFDSLFSSCVAEDLFFWEKDIAGRLQSVNYDYKNRKRRQDIEERYIENGSFYIFTPDVLSQFNNRFGNNIGTSIMESWKMYEIDNNEDIGICRAIMNEFLLNKDNLL